MSDVASITMLSPSSPIRDLPICGGEGIKDSAGAMNSSTPSTVTSDISLQQPKAEIELFSHDDLDLGPFQQLETQLLDSMEISEQQSSQSHIPKALAQEKSYDRQLKHDDRLHKYIKGNGKIPVIFRKKDGHPIGEYASVFMIELGTAVKNFVPVRISGWKDVTEEQKQRMFDWLESSFVVDFGPGPKSVRKETEKLMNARFRNYRRYMHRHYKTLVHLPWEERLKCVPKEYCESEEDWTFMCMMFESETFKKKSIVNSGNAKIRSPFYRRKGWKSLSLYKDDAGDGSGEKNDMTCSNETDNLLEKGCPGESAMTSNNYKQIGSDNQEDCNQFLDGVDTAKRACDLIQESRAAYVAGLRNGIELAKKTCSDDMSLTSTNSELRIELATTQHELHSTQIALQSTEDRVRILEANQKRLEETIHGNAQMVEANQKRLEASIQANQQMMKHVFEKIASDITQSLTQLPSSASPPPRL